MKNVILLTVALFFSVISCSDDASENGSLVGTWDLTGVSSEGDGESHTMSQEEVDDDPLTYILNADSTGIQHYKEKTYDFNWEADQNTVVFSSYNETHTYNYTVNSETLKLTFPIQKYTITHTFQRQ